MFKPSNNISEKNIQNYNPFGIRHPKNKLDRRYTWRNKRKKLEKGLGMYRQR